MPFLFKNIKQPPEPVGFYRDALLGSRNKTILIGEAIVGKPDDPVIPPKNGCVEN